MVKGLEFHAIIQNIFPEVRGIMHTEQIQVNCPRCQDNDGLGEPDGKFNLEINTGKRMFRCWKCDEPRFSGSLGRLINTFGSKIDYDLYKSYAGISYDYEFNEEKEIVEVKLPNEMVSFSQLDVTNPDHFEAYNYLVNDRKISREIILRYRLGFCTTGKYAQRIIIPSFDKDGEVNYFVARYYGNNKKINKKFPYLNPDADKNLIIFNEGLINWDSTIYLVEGAFEMLSLPVNSVPMLGKTLSPTLFRKLKENKPNVVILLDPDAYKNSIELFYNLETIYLSHEDRVKIIKLPTTDDLDEYRKKYGDKKMIDILYTARGMIVDDYFENKLKKPYVNYSKYGR